MTYLIGLICSNFDFHICISKTNIIVFFVFLFFFCFYFGKVSLKNKSTHKTLTQHMYCLYDNLLNTFIYYLIYSNIKRFELWLSILDQLKKKKCMDWISKCMHGCWKVVLMWCCDGWANYNFTMWMVYIFSIPNFTREEY